MGLDEQTLKNISRTHNILQNQPRKLYKPIIAEFGYSKKNASMHLSLKTSSAHLLQANILAGFYPHVVGPTHISSL